MDKKLSKEKITEIISSFLIIVYSIFMGGLNGSLKQKHLQKGGSNLLFRIPEYTLKKASLLTDSFLSLIMDKTILDAPLSELTPNLNKKIISLAHYLKAIADDPEQLKLVKETAEEFTSAGIDIIKAIKPSLERITNKVVETADEVGNEAAVGLSKTFKTMAEAVIAEIPWIGGIIILMSSFGTGFNSAAKITQQSVNASKEISTDFNNMREQTSNILNNHLPSLTTKIEQLTNVNPSTNKPVNKEEEERRLAELQAQNKKGGKIKNSTVRINKLLNKFNKTLKS